MKKRVFALITAAFLLLTACGQSAPAKNASEETRLSVVATTYPIYLFANTVVSNVEGVEVLRLDTGDTSCLHDYNLTVDDMKKIEKADVIAMNGMGLEEFLEDALSTSDALIIDCSEGVELLENRSHHHDEHDHSHEGHDHGHFDPHIWMSATNAAVMVKNIAENLKRLDPEHAETYEANVVAAMDLLAEGKADFADQMLNAAASAHTSLDSVCTHKQLITFHDGFQYFVRAIDLELLESIEEEAGSEASAKEIVEIAQLVREHDIPAIFTEKNGSDATANAIARETGVQVCQLDMIMSGDGEDIRAYFDAMKQNIQTVMEALK